VDTRTFLHRGLAALQRQPHTAAVDRHEHRLVVFDLTVTHDVAQRRVQKSAARPMSCTPTTTVPMCSTSAFWQPRGAMAKNHGSTPLTLSVHLAHRVTTALGSTVMTGPVRR
jgi:hypothetical protein